LNICRVESSLKSRGMLISFRSLRTKLLFTFLLFVLLTGCVGLLSVWFYQRIDKLGDVTSRLDNVLVKTLQVIKVEKDFFSSGTLDTNFYRTGESEYLLEHGRMVAEIRQDLSTITQVDEISHFDIHGNVTRLQNELDAYEKTFHRLADQIKIRGFENQGLEGQVRRYSQAIENSRYPISQVKLLTLLRLEKDYMIQKQSDYAYRFRELYYQMRSELPFDETRQSQHFDSLITNYHLHFKELVRVEGMIGNNERGMHAQLRRQSARLDSQIRATIVKANQRSKELRHWFQGTSMLVVLIAVVLSIAFSYIHSYRISKPVRSLTSQTSQIISGHIKGDTVPLQASSNDEVSTITQNFNVMIQEIQFYLGEIQEKNQALESQNLELQAINDQLTQSEASLRRLNLMKDKFFFIISHDLKGPLNTLSGFLSVLNSNADTFTKQEIRQVGVSMNASVRSLLNLLNNLLQWSVAQTGELKVEPVVFSLTESVKESMDLMRETAKTKNIELVSNLDSEFMIRSDRNMMDSILRNLISNAIKFTHAGGEVRIKAWQKQTFVEVTVEDTGVGISQEDLKQLFRGDVHHTTLGTTQEKGTGFGLLLCKEFVEKNGGQISIHSQLGKGTSIIFTIPLVEVMQMAAR
jgi:signal transduction histidine kinase